MMPTDAQVTVIGGGAIGAAIVYYLAKEGWTDIQLLEAGLPGNATSSQAAGLLGQPRTTLERTRITMHTADVLRGLADETGFDPDWNETGSVRVAMSRPAVTELRQIAAVADRAGLEIELVDGPRARELFPPLEQIDDIALALHCPSDGYVQPNSLINAFLGAARGLGVRVVPHCRVVGIDVDDGVVTGVRTTNGDVRAELVIDAAGPWGGAVAAMVGLELPIVPVAHQYFVTEPLNGWHSGLPCLRIPEIQVYARGEGAGALCGGFEHTGTSIDPQTVEVDSPLTAEPRWEVLGGFAESFSRFAPLISDAGVQTVFKGWPGFTPDGKFVVGRVDGLRGFAMASGCNAHGVSGSAGLAEHLLESLGDDISPYVASLSPNRFLPRTWSWHDARVQAQGICENYYPLPAWPEPTTRTLK
jgi:glycine/D-amino acid oxidase-like deaminating enzyme